MAQVHLSVRQLVEFLLQTGSIDSRFSGFDRAAEGARIHRRLQRAEGKGYDAEVYLKQEYTVKGVEYLIDGRADGIFTEDGLVTVDEIKTVTVPLEEITEDMQPVHWAQGQVYAAIYARQQDLEAIRVRLTYFQVDEEKIVRFSRRFTANELDSFVEDLLTRYAPWAKRARSWQEQRTGSLQALRFPFSEYRAGQRALAAGVYRTLRDGQRLLCQAPTGIGKTISTLFPALKAMGEGCDGRIFYLTARSTTRAAAEGALARLRENQLELRLKSITLTAKDKVCLLEKRECTPEACPYARGYYDRLRDALWQALDEDDFTRAKLEELARRFTLCPFEFGLDVSLWCDVIVGDYNYLFDPVVNLKRFFEAGGDHLFLVDEAHNLPDRARDMHSAGLCKSEVFRCVKLLGKGRGKLKTALNRLNRAFIDLRHQCEEEPGHTFFSAPALTEFDRCVSRVTGPMEEWLEEHREGEAHDTMLDLYFELRQYLRAAEWYDDHFVTQVSAGGSEVRVWQLCLDPSAFVNASLSKGRGAVLFSATLSPAGYFKDILGCTEAKTAALPSPFDSARLGLFCAADVSTRYKDRAQSLEAIARYLHAMAAGQKGNYIAFFPSYSYLAQVREVFCRLFPEVETLVQEAGMDDSAREDFLARFTPAAALLGFGVLGGVFGEGVDLVGRRLIGAAIVGVGLPQVGPRQEMLRRYFDQTRGDGFDYAYRFPGFNKVLQAAGRVIRTAEDKGVVLLIDDRFAAAGYRQLFPEQWRHCRYLYGPEELAEQLSAFWGRDE
ncbi:ATP-dependent DNA helicase [Candidatus Allofournierella merdipullorum]|uniref:ATP-dependent DNA helicase n=1 Tax=Candidatus Allofournierella merdipullorum TaxID=2838595 RepID=UPI003AB7588B